MTIHSEMRPITCVTFPKILHNFQNLTLKKEVCITPNAQLQSDRFDIYFTCQDYLIILLCKKASYLLWKFLRRSFKQLVEPGAQLSPSEQTPGITAHWLKHPRCRHIRSSALTTHTKLSHICPLFNIHLSQKICVQLKR